MAETELDGKSHGLHCSAQYYAHSAPELNMIEGSCLCGSVRFQITGAVVELGKLSLLGVPQGLRRSLRYRRRI